MLNLVNLVNLFNLFIIIMKQLTCPSCWAKINIVPGIISYVCSYCNTISLFERQTLTSTWEKSEIISFPTTIEYGKTIFAVKNNNSNDEIIWQKVEYFSEKEFNDKNLKDYLVKFYVYWHIRYTTDTSFFDKFFLRILDTELKLDKNKDIIAEEDEGQIKLYYAEKLEDKWFFEKLFNSNKVNEEGFFIQEKWIQNIEWFEWWLPFEITWVKTSKYLNLVWPWPKNYLIENYGNWEILFGEGI